LFFGEKDKEQSTQTPVHQEKLKEKTQENGVISMAVRRKWCWMKQRTEQRDSA